MLGSTIPETHITVLASDWALWFTASGCETFFGGAEGMCGSFDQGGINDSNGNPQTILTPGWSPNNNNYAANLATGAVLAQSWMIASGESMFSDPSTICDASASCGNPNDVFTCDATRRHLQVSPGCTKTCADIPIQQFEDQCERDIDITGKCCHRWNAYQLSILEYMLTFHMCTLFQRRQYMGLRSCV